MHGGHDVRRECGFHEFAATLRDAKFAVEQCLRGRGAEADDDLRPEQRDFGFEQRPAGGDLGGVRFLVDASFATRLPFEMFDDVGNVSCGAVDTGFREGSVEQFSCGADERVALQIFLIAGLFAYK